MNITRKIPYRKIEDGFLYADVYHPETSDAELLIYLGDGVQRNDMDSRLLYRLLDDNYAVAILSYRDIADCIYGIRWLQTNMADAEIITDRRLLIGAGKGGFITLRLGLRGLADLVCTLHVNFPKTGLHEDIAKQPARFLMVHATSHPNMKHVRQLHSSLERANVNSKLVTLSSNKLSDTAANTIADTLLMFFKRWI